MIISLLSLLNAIIWLAVLIIVILEFLKADYPYKNHIDKELSKIQVPFSDSYNIFFIVFDTYRD